MKTYEYKIICLDMFQTLVNIDARKNDIWKRILKDEYSENLKNKYVNLVNRKIVKISIQNSAEIIILKI